MPNQIEKLITALEKLEIKDGKTYHAKLIEEMGVNTLAKIPQLLKILHAHKFLLEGVEGIHDGRWCTKQCDDLLNKHNEML